jgi:prepilin-type N-terminal cleavage/methylation domain-containing protein
MNKHRGFTFIELLIGLAIIGIVLSIVAIPFINPPGKTEASAYEAADQFIAANSLQVKRKTCAHDSDGDGQASCTIALNDGEKIFLSCPVGILNTAFGAKSCKEVSEMMMFQHKAR